MKVAIRTDASTEIGTGHVMRCLTLAEALKERGVKVNFICRELKGNIIKYIREKGFPLITLPETKITDNNLCSEDPPHAKWLGVSWQKDAEETVKLLPSRSIYDWLVVDHYALDYRWEKQLRALCKRIFIIDDLADREHDCDLLLDQNFYKNIRNRYFPLVPSGCKMLLGPTYALLRHEFIEARNKLVKRNFSIKRVMIFFGGSDSTNETAKALEAIDKLKWSNVEVDVIIGGLNPHREFIERLCQQNSNYYCYFQTSRMADLMLSANLAIGAGGATTLERMYLGLPSVVITIAKNQEKSIIELSLKGCLIYAGKSGDVTSTKLANILANLSEKRLRKISKKDTAIVKGQGIKHICANLMKK